VIWFGQGSSQANREAALHISWESDQNVVVPKLVVMAVVDIVETRVDNPNFEQHWHQA